MGYYVSTTMSHFTLPREHMDDAYRALCALNADDTHKTGGAYPEDAVRPADSTSVSTNPNRWFAWMPWNYDEICPDVVSILETLGFEVTTDDTGIIDLAYPEQKTGQEDLFLEALAPYVTPGSFIVWTGEEGETWVDDFDGTQMLEETFDPFAMAQRMLNPSQRKEHA